ncbi:MAG: hypothetical protein KGM47_07395 [Acidobacteriota bacterium]|nr:hypothetical protein [Acidobacteriota bacterium]
MRLDTQTGLEHAQEADDFPLFLYLYDPRGFYRGAKRLNNSEELKTAVDREIVPAIREGREVRICDSNDFLCFHAKAGEVVYPANGRTGNV